LPTSYLESMHAGDVPHMIPSNKSQKFRCWINFQNLQIFATDKLKSKVVM